ncbi:MAG: S-layer protein [Candidatus Bathyarchaeia archaeon]
MAYLVEESADGQRAFASLIASEPSLFKVLSNSTALALLRALAREPMCAADLAKRLDENEFKTYYHIRRLEDLGLIQVARTETRGGATAKIYKPISSVVSFKLFESAPVKDVRTRAPQLEFLKPFVEEGRLNAIIIVGSPEPHGRFKAPASDGYCAIDLCLFLGQFIGEFKVPCYKLDTQVKEEDLVGNLILVGGPKANIITDRLNKELPIYFDYSAETLDWNIVSGVSKTTYREKQVGAVLRVPSPYAQGREILILAGKGFRGTRAAVLAFTKHLDQVMRGNTVRPGFLAKVVQGVDVDSDGIVDEVEFLE